MDIASSLSANIPEIDRIIDERRKRLEQAAQSYGAGAQLKAAGLFLLARLALGLVVTVVFGVVVGVVKVLSTIL